MPKTFKNSDWLVLIAGGHFLLLVYLKDSQSTLSFTGVYMWELHYWVHLDKVSHYCVLSLAMQIRRQSVPPLVSPDQYY